MSYRDTTGASVESAFSDFAAGLLLREGDLALVLQSYFDESISGSTLCVAGYVFTQRDARMMDRKWSAMLADWGLPYFHMGPCAHGNPPFDKLSKAQRIKAETKAISLIKKYAQFGVAVTIDQDEFAAVMPSREGLPPHIALFVNDAYDLCVWLCMQSVRFAVQEFGHRDARIGYFFEQGHLHQRRANRVMSQILAVPELRAAYQCAGFGFVPKEAGGPIQAADLLAWQWAKDRKNKAEGRPRRKDLESLIERAVKYMHIDARDHANLTQRIIDREMAEFAAMMRSISSSTGQSS